MTLTLEIPPEVQGELDREAEARGLPIPALAVQLLQEAVARTGLAKTDPTRPRPRRSVHGSIRSLSFRIGSRLTV
jgi:hypothetical protein